MVVRINMLADSVKADLNHTSEVSRRYVQLHAEMGAFSGSGEKADGQTPEEKNEDAPAVQKPEPSTAKAGEGAASVSMSSESKPAVLDSWGTAGQETGWDQAENQSGSLLGEHHATSLQCCTF